MTQWGLDTLFNPAKRHMDEEKRRLQSTREEVGDNSGGRRIDLESGKVVIRKAEDEQELAADEAAANEAAADKPAADKPAADEPKATGAKRAGNAKAAPSAAAQRAAARRGRTAR